MQNARIMIAAADAIRNYSAVDLGPLLPMERDGKFVGAQRNDRRAIGLRPDGYSARDRPPHLCNLPDHPDCSAIADAVSLGEEDVEAYVKPGNDEISSLSVSFNRMRESVKQAMAIIK
jgi:hypothetical protein